MTYLVENRGVRPTPMTGEEISKLVRLGMLGSLDRISADGRTWQLLRSTPFWKPVQTMRQHAAVAPKPVPVTKPAARAAAHTAAVTAMDPGVVADSRPPTESSVPGKRKSPSAASAGRSQPIPEVKPVGGVITEEILKLLKKPDWMEV